MRYTLTVTMDNVDATSNTGISVTVGGEATARTCDGTGPTCVFANIAAGATVDMVAGANTAAATFAQWVGGNVCTGQTTAACTQFLMPASAASTTATFAGMFKCFSRGFLKLCCPYVWRPAFSLL